jgi:hypothetical protein
VKDPICAREREQEEIDGRKNEKKGRDCRQGRKKRKREKKGVSGDRATGREREIERCCDVRGHREGKKRKRWRRMGYILICYDQYRVSIYVSVLSFRILINHSNRLYLNLIIIL